MPYYRIVIWTTRRNQPFIGIKLIGDPNINTVYKAMRCKAADVYRNDLLEMEVQMLSKLCKAVIEFEKLVTVKSRNQ